MWEVANHGKRGMAIDISKPEGGELILQMAEEADVFVTNFLTEGRRKLVIDVEEVMERNPRIIYARGSGQGPAGPDAELGGFDGLTYWERGGIAATLTPVGGDHPVRMAGPGLGDVQSGTALVGGIGAALFQRERSGKGVAVDVSLLSAGMWAMQPTVVAASLTGVDVLPIPAHDDIGNPLVNTYRTSDGRHLTLSMLESDRYWLGFREVTRRSDLVNDPGFAGSAAPVENRAALTAILAELFGSHTLAEWKDMLGRQEEPWTVLQYPGEVARDPQAEANGYVQDVNYGDGRTLRLVSAPVQFDESPGTLTPAPQYGAQTEEVLQEMGCDSEDLGWMNEAGVII